MKVYVKEKTAMSNDIQERVFGIGFDINNPPDQKSAKGTYWNPTRQIVQCYQQNIDTLRQYFPTGLTYW